MMTTRLLLLLLLTGPMVQAQNSLAEKKVLEATRTDEIIRVDGNLEEGVWRHAQAATDFSEG